MSRGGGRPELEGTYNRNANRAVARVVVRTQLYLYVSVNRDGLFSLWQVSDLS